MSRYSIEPHAALRQRIPRVQVVVGFDPPLQTLFCHVYNPDLPMDQNDCIVCLGTRPQEYTSVDVLQVAMASYAVMPPDIRAVLEAEYARRTVPTPLQQEMSRLVESVGRKP